VIPVEHDGATHLVSTRGQSQWVRNVRAAGAVQVGATSYSAVELPVEQSGAVIAAYRVKAGRTVEAYWKQLPEDADHPVFRLS